MTVLIERSLRLPESEYFPGAERKSGIAIHHTVSGSAETTYRIWRRDTTNGTRKRLVATAYVIDHDGTIYEVFPPDAWAYQFGLTWSTAQRLQFERRFIGIEIVSEGALVEQEGAGSGVRRGTSRVFLVMRRRPPAIAWRCESSNCDCTDRARRRADPRASRREGPARPRPRGAVPSDCQSTQSGGQAQHLEVSRGLHVSTRCR
jgi:hypothetical protein